MEKNLRQLISIEFEEEKRNFTGFLIDYSDDWIFQTILSILSRWLCFTKNKK
jgi:hypothetical protein